MWTASEKKFLLSLNTPAKIQNYLDSLDYNSAEEAASPRYTMMSGDCHCFEGCLIAAAAMELQGYPPLLVDLVARDDDDHLIMVYKTKTGWGSISKSSTSVLRGRRPYYKTIRELVMSYFDFYFNPEGFHSLYAYSDPINLNRYNNWNWRTSDFDLSDLGRSFNDLVHYELVDLKELKKLPKVNPILIDACYLKFL